MFKIYGRENCVWCKRALEHIRTNFPNDEIDYIDYEKDSSALTFLRDNGFKTVPQVYYGSEHVGGYESLVEFTIRFYGTNH